MQPQQQPFFDIEEYREQLRIRNKIICSFSRLESFLEAQPEVSAANNYTIAADVFCPHNQVYFFDDEGICTVYVLVEEGLIGQQ